MDSATYLTTLSAGMPIVYGGDRITYVNAELAAAFAPGDRLIVVQTTGDLLHVPGAAHGIATDAVDAAVAAFDAMGTVSDDQVSAFYEAFALRLADDDAFAPIAAANEADVVSARERGRSATRLILSDKMRGGHDFRPAVLAGCRLGQGGRRGNGASRWLAGGSGSCRPWGRRFRLRGPA